MGEGLLLAGHQAAEPLQHRQLRLALFTFELAQAIAQGDHRLGLDEHRAARGRTVVHQAGQLAGRSGLHRQHRPAVALRHHAVLQQGGEAPQQPIEAIATVGAGGRDLPPQFRQGGTGPIGHPAAIVDAKAQALLQLRQGAQLLHQGSGHRAQVVIIDLAAQAPRCRQGGGHGEQVVGRSDAALGAELQGAAQIRHTLEVKATLGEAIEGQQLGGFSQQALALRPVRRQRELQAEAAAGGRAGKASHMLPQSGPLQQLQRFSLDVVHSACDHTRPAAIGAAPMLDGRP